MAEKNTLILGTRKGLLIYKKQNGRWEQVCEAHPGVPVSYAVVDHRTGTLWAGLDHGHWGQKLHRSNDGGASWEEIPSPAYDERDLVDDKPAKLSYLWLIQPGGDDQPNRLYIGTEPGGLFRSDDGGATFQKVEGLWNHPTRIGGWFGGGRDHPGLCSIVVDPRDSKHLTIGISVGGVYESWDDGATWEPRNKGMLACYLPDPHAEVGHDPHFMIASPSNPDVLWQQNHCGIFRSADGGKTWQDISQPNGPARFGFAIAPDAEDENTAWVVPATSDEQRIAVQRALVVCRTEDGGKTWQELRTGLPQENCYDLVYRHALDIAGQRLAFGTTTGHVFISDNRGDSWECIAHYLPPVLSVRFTDTF